VVNSEVLTVSEGDEIQIFVATYDPEMFWALPEGTVNWSLGFEADEAEVTVREGILVQKRDDDIRLIAYVDDLAAYSSVAFTVTINEQTSKELVCTTAYAGLYANDEFYTTEDIYGADGYFVTYVITGYLSVYSGQEVTITATYTTVDGDTIVDTRTMTVSKN
jgi:hypothetical protein